MNANLRTRGPEAGNREPGARRVNTAGQVLFASLIGTTIEFFDFYIYATAAVLVFPRLFFPSTDPASKPAQLELKGRVGVTSILTLHGRVGPLVGPLRLDVNGDLRGFAVPRTNSYLVEHVAWEARDGWLSTAFRCRIEGDTLYTAVDEKPKRTRRLRRLVNVEAEPRVEVVIDQYEEDWSQLSWVRLRGRAGVVERDERALQLLCAKYPQYRERPPLGPFVVVEIDDRQEWAAVP